MFWFHNHSGVYLSGCLLTLFDLLLLTGTERAPGVRTRRATGLRVCIFPGCLTVRMIIKPETTTNVVFFKPSV